LQFFLAPTNLKGENPRPELRPIAISNSYGCNPIRCPNPEIQRPSVEALTSAGVLFIVSAGNSGPRCSTIDRAPTHYEKSLVVGATDYQNFNLASFSSRGPVTVDRSNRTKPDITAPGVRVYSSTPPNSYAIYSGTSMASPAVNGCIAVLYSAVPRIARNIKCVREILDKSSRHQESLDCQSKLKSPNNLFGWGSINLENALAIARNYTCK